MTRFACCSTTGPRRGRQSGRAWDRSLLCPAYSKTPFAGGGPRFRRQGNSWAGAEPTDELSVGAVGTLRQKGDAIPERGSPRGERRGWEGDFL